MPEYNKEYRKYGRSMQILLFITNGFSWVISLLAICGGLTIGFGTNTITIEFDYLDFLITTPATYFIWYGFSLSLITTLGCFASTWSTLDLIISYIICCILYIIFDCVVGEVALYTLKAPIILLEKISISMQGYQNDSASYVGMIPIHPTRYWNHLQSKGKCCGVLTYKDWKNTPYGRINRSVPDSCCNDDHNYRHCGQMMLYHPNWEGHNVEHMVHMTGCFNIFPKTLMNNMDTVGVIGIMLGTLMIFSIVFAFVLMCFVCTHRFNPRAEGIDTLDVKFDERAIIEKGLQDKGIHKPGEWYDDEAGDRQRPDIAAANAKKVSFEESGPKYIPSQSDLYGNRSVRNFQMKTEVFKK